MELCYPCEFPGAEAAVRGAPDRWKLDARRNSRVPIHSSRPATGWGVPSSCAITPLASSPAPLGRVCSPAPTFMLRDTQSRRRRCPEGFEGGGEVHAGGPTVDAATCALSMAPPTVPSSPAGHLRQSSSSLLSKQSSSSSHLHTEGMQRSFWHRNWFSSHSLTSPGGGGGRGRECDPQTLQSWQRTGVS